MKRLILLTLYIFSSTTIFSQRLYWTDSQKREIATVKTDGTDRQNIHFGLIGNNSIEYDPVSDKIYWTDGLTAKVQRSNADGTQPEDLVSNGLDSPGGITVDQINQKAYFRDDGKIIQMNLDGTGMADILTGLIGPTEIVVDPTNGKLYWIEMVGQLIKRADIDGTNVETIHDFGPGPFDSRDLYLDLTNSKLYWSFAISGSDKIQRSDLDGNNKEDVITGLITPLGLFIDGVNGKIYWGNGLGEVKRADLNGANEEAIVTGLDRPAAITHDVTNNKVVWSDSNADRIQRSNLDGSLVEDIVYKPVNAPRGVAIDNNKIYWSDIVFDGIIRSNLDGSNIEFLINDSNGPNGLALDLVNNKMYWTDQGSNRIRRSDLDGSNIEELIVGQGLDAPLGISLDVASNKMYWTDGSTDKIQRANLDGTNVEDLLTSSDGLIIPTQIELDLINGKMYWSDPGTTNIHRANLDGSAPEVVIPVAGAYGMVIDIANNDVYWTSPSQGNIQMADIDDAIASEVISSGIKFPRFLFLESDGAFAAPTIANFSPQTAEPGAMITLSGSNFGAAAINNKVFFGNIEASVQSASTTTIDVEVPLAAQTDKITAFNTSTALSAQTGLQFIPTFNGGANIISTSMLPPQSLPLLGEAKTVRTGDIDGDGWLDIVAVSRTEIFIYRNLGTGGILSVSSFGTRIDISPGLGEDPGSGLNDINFADLDGDGKMDLYFSVDVNQGLAVASGRIGILHNISTPGTISFDPAIGIDASERLSYIAAGDIDGDGKQELIAASGTSCGGLGPDIFNLMMFQNNSTSGSLSFGSEVTITSTACAHQRIKVMDINGDNKLDIAIQRNLGSPQVDMFLNQATLGVIDANSFKESITPIDGALTLSLADFDGDGLPELLTSNSGNNTGIAIRKNLSTASDLIFGEIIAYNSGSFNEGEISVADMNGDGMPDIVVGNAHNQQWVSILQNQSAGTLDATSFKQPVLYEAIQRPTSIAVADLDRDGKPDIVTSSQTSFLSILQNSIAFPPIINAISSYSGGVGDVITLTGEHFGLTPADNRVRFGNVQANVMTASTTSLTVEVPHGNFYKQISVTVNALTGKSQRKFNTTFSAGSAFDVSSLASPISFSASSDVTTLDLGDLDNDGKVDILIRPFNAGIFKNQSATNVLDNSSFVQVSSSAVGINNDIILEDIDGDGYLDAVSKDRVSRNISATGTEPIEFGPIIPISSGLFVEHIAVSDINHDGLSDIVPTSNTTSIGVVESFVSRSFTRTPINPFPASFSYTKAATFGSPSVADLDGDGWEEMIATNPSTDNISIFRNLGLADNINAASFDTPIEFAVGDNPAELATGDLDLDGKIDLAIVNVTDHTVTVLHNQSTVGSFVFDTYIYAVSAAPSLIRIHDLDGDGKPEIITVNSGPSFSVFKNNTAFTINMSSFATETVYSLPAANAQSDLEIADLDDDGRPDLAFASSNPDEIRIIKNLSPIIGASTIVIGQQPIGANICSGANTTLTIQASGANNLSYKWQEDQGSGYEDLTEVSPYSGTGSAILSISNTLVSLSGYQYRCIVSGDNAPDVLSVSVTVNVTASIEITTQPDDQTINTGDNITFTITATGDNVDYQWQKDDVNLSGEVMTSITLLNVSLTDQGSYKCMVSNSCGSVTSNTADLMVIGTAISIDTQPQDQTACEGGNISFTVAASGDTGLTYQWQEDQGSGFIDIMDNIAFSGTSNPTLSVSNIDAVMSSHKYQCVISGENAQNSTTNPATLNVTVIPKPIATLINDVLMAPSGADAYQWFKQNQEIVGATSQDLGLTRPLRTGDFTVRVSQGGCFKISDPLLVTGISDWQLEKPLIYPIPFSESFTISNLENQQKVLVEIWDMSGERHFQKQNLISTNNKITLNTERISPGIYLFLLHQNGYVYSQRIIKR